jgi:hypothetical protein
MKASAASSRARGRSWRVIVSLLLLAFTLQSYITQTHIHSLTPASVSRILTGSHDPAPVDGNPVDCPFCQAVAHDGPFFLPAAPILLLSAIWVELTPSFLSARTDADAPAHAWHSRAPPHH